MRVPSLVAVVAPYTGKIVKHGKFATKWCITFCD